MEPIMVHKDPKASLPHFRLSPCPNNSYRSPNELMRRGRAVNWLVLHTTDTAKKQSKTEQYWFMAKSWQKAWILFKVLFTWNWTNTVSNYIRNSRLHRHKLGTNTRTAIPRFARTNAQGAKHETIGATTNTLDAYEYRNYGTFTLIRWIEGGLLFRMKLNATVYHACKKSKSNSIDESKSHRFVFTGSSIPGIEVWIRQLI